VHGVSNSRGEECCANQNNSAAVEATMKEVIGAWATAYGGHSKKLAWLKEDPVHLFDAAVTLGGMGVRGGIIENWLRGQYTPGDTRLTGQIYDNGYLLVDEGFAPIAQGRTWMDQNEEYEAKIFTSQERLQQNYRMSTLRMLQMRRNIAWTERNSFVNPTLLNWMSLELGKTVNTSPDAWVVLMSSWTRWNGDREVKNLERWLYQRDASGAMTSPALRLDHSFNASGNDMLDASKWYAYLARTGEAIGIAVDDRFLSAGPQSVAIKVTYLDSGSAQWSLDYTKSDGSSGTRKVQGSASNVVRTATFFLSDFTAGKRGMDFDFLLRSPGGTTPFMFVRVVRLDGAVPEAVPRPPESVVIQ